MTELGWYEDTEISMIIEGSELVLAEKWLDRDVQT
jgi:hypothetical protein